MTTVNGDGQLPAQSSMERAPGRPFVPGQSGNPGGRPKGLEKLAREIVGGGTDLMQFCRDVFDGKPFMRKVIQLLPLRKDGKPRAKPYVEFDVPVYPTLDQRLEAAERLEVRGWGKPKQDVVIDDIGGGGGFKLVYRRWPVGVDPTQDPPPGERIITGTAKALPPSSTNGTTGT